MTNGLYGARCSSVNKNPPITVTAPPGQRGIPSHAPLFGQNDVNPVLLHGVWVISQRQPALLPQG